MAQVFCNGVHNDLKDHPRSLILAEIDSA